MFDKPVLPWFTLDYSGMLREGQGERIEGGEKEGEKIKEGRREESRGKEGRSDVE